MPNLTPESPVRKTNLRFYKRTSENLLDGRFGIRPLKEVGSGYAGTVYKCSSGGVVVAAKLISKRRIKGHAAESEARLLQKARGANVVDLHLAVECIDAYILVTEYCSGGDLHGLLNFMDNSDVMAREYMRGVANGLARLHEKLIAHCDVKMRNILISTNNEPKIADFGFAMLMKHKNDKTSTCHGTKDYWAPEMWKSSPSFSPFKTDIYALGVTFLGVCEKRPLKRKEDDASRVLNNIRDPQKKALFKGLLNPKPEDRMSLLDMTKNLWITATLSPPPSP